MKNSKIFWSSIFMNFLLFIIVFGFTVYYDTPRTFLRASRNTYQEYFKAKSLPKHSSAFLNKLESGGPVLIVAFGDSVTEGAMSTEYDFYSVYHYQLTKMLHEKYPNNVINMINSGRGGDTIERGLKRIGSDVIRFSPDLAIIKFGLNDSKGGFDGIDQFKQTLLAAVLEILEKTEADIILVTPNFMATEDNDNVRDEHRIKGWVDELTKRQNSGLLYEYSKAIKEVGNDAGVLIADVYSEWEKMSSSIDTNLLLANGLNHPCPKGHGIAAKTILEAITKLQ